MNWEPNRHKKILMEVLQLLNEEGMTELDCQCYRPNAHVSPKFMLKSNHNVIVSGSGAFGWCIGYEG